MSAPVIDVSPLPSGAMDHRSPIWWGNFLLILIETTMFALLLAVYFYLRGNFAQWPPPLVHGPFAILHPRPKLLGPTINLAVILASCVPMALAARAALHRRQRAVRNWLAVTILFGLATIALRFLDFGALRFRWDDNAYAAVVWTIAGMHLLHLITGTLENFIMVLWICRRGLDQKHARDVRVTAGYWYWVAAIWVPLYAVVFTGPRFF
jgi:heme/copper-type cytochrome/quinol oxidase subunit 3